MKNDERMALCRELWMPFNALTTTLQNVIGTVRYDMPHHTRQQLKYCRDIESCHTLLYTIVKLAASPKGLQQSFEEIARSCILGPIDRLGMGISNDLNDLQECLLRDKAPGFYIEYVDRRIHRFHRHFEELYHFLDVLTRDDGKEAK